MVVNYEGVERLESFGSPANLQKYRDMLLEKTEPQAAFIAKHVWEPARKPLQVVEIGSGNGRLLISLALKGMLDKAAGIDLSCTRTQFAKSWAKELSLSSQLYFYSDSVLELSRRWVNRRFNPAVDLAVCITGCIQYFTSLLSAKHVLQYMRESANQALFELYKLPKQQTRVDKLPPGDPWEYYYHEYEQLEENVYRHRKTFWKDQTVDHRFEDLRYYTMPEFLELLRSVGYTKFPWAVEDDTKMVILCQA